MVRRPAARRACPGVRAPCSSSQPPMWRPSMKICGTVVRPPARWIISSRSRLPPKSPHAPDTRCPWRRAGASPGSNKPQNDFAYRFRPSARRFLTRCLHQRINCDGRTTRAQLISSTRAAPARCSSLAQALAVLPVVSTSSTRTTVRPSKRRRSIDLERAGDGLPPLLQAHALERRRPLDALAAARASLSQPGRLRDSSRATIADWLNPRCHSRAAMQRHRHEQRVAAACSPTSGAM